MKSEKPSVIAVSAVRNEITYLPRTAPSIFKQSYPPSVYVIVDDGSTDGTEKYLKTLHCLTIYLKTPRVDIRGYNQSYALIKGVEIAEKHCPEWDYLLKTDGDTQLSPRYIENLLEIMEKNQKIGIIGGFPEHEKIRLSGVSDAARIYRRACWNQIGGLDVKTAFDTHALLKACQCGWKVGSIPTITFKELRPQHRIKLKWWIIEGNTRKNFGFPLWYTFLAVIKNIFTKPYIIGPITAILSHIITPRKPDSKLSPIFVKRFAVKEVKTFGKTVWRHIFD